MRWFARLAFLFSGIAGLMFEVVWLRHLGLAVGATSLAVATTTAAYMGGLALGSHFGGRLADRKARPLAVYGALEVLVALTGLLVPLACRFIPLFDEHWLTSVNSGFGRALARFFAAMVVLIIPTTAMGMTLPLLARAVVAKLSDVGREVGLLYAMNLVGAVLGAALAGFVLIPNLGLARTNLVAVGLDLTLGLVAVAAGMRLSALPVATPSSRTTPALRAGSRVVVALLVVTGASAMALQVLWTRGLGTALGPSTYAFSAIVCAYLVGLAIGGGVASRIAGRTQNTHFALAIALLATSLAVGFGIFIVDDLPLLLRPVVLDHDLTMGGLVRTEFLLAAASLLPATVGMGTLFPLTLAAVVGNEQRVGAAVGRAYACNTLGNIAGSFAAVFILLPAVGVEWGMRLCAMSYVVAALVLLPHLAPMLRRRGRVMLAGTAVVVLAFLALWPTWDIGHWTLGTFRLSMARAYFSDADANLDTNVIFHADGLASTVTVEEDMGVRWVKVNGKIDGSSEGDMPTQVLSGLLPMWVHPAPKRVAVIGCGTCVTAGATLAAGPQSVTLVELESQVVRAASLFAAVNHEPWKDPRFHVVEDDGRNYLMRPGPTFDVIVSEPSNPWMTGAASLFTLEFFRIAERRLADNGMFLQWLQAYELSPERIASVFKTFNAVFPYVVVFSAHPDSNDLLLLGSRKPISLNRAALAARYPTMASELARAEIESVDDLLTLVLFTNEELRTLSPSIELNTDDNALIEFGAPRDLVAFAEDDPEVPLISAYHGRRIDILRKLGGLNDRLSGASEDKPSSLLSLAWSFLRRGMLDDATTTGRVLTERGDIDAEMLAATKQIADLAALLGGDDDSESVVDSSQKLSAPYREAAKALRQEEVEAVLSGLSSRPAQNNRDRLLYAYLLYRAGRYSEARKYFQKAAQDAALTDLRPAISYYLAKVSYNDGAYARAVNEMQEYRKLKPPAAPRAGN